MRAVEADRRDKLALVSEEAAEWFVRLKDDGLTGAEQEEYLIWLKSSPNHIAEALRMGRTFARARQARLGAQTSDEDLSNIISLNSQDAAGTAERPAPEEDRRGWRFWSIAAVLPALVLGVLLLIARQAGWFSEAIETRAGEWRQLTLSDGTIVRAGPHTRLQIRFEKGRRLVRIPDGEAAFQVAKDPSRPFVVEAGAATVRAVGTEFGVSRKDSRILVTVAEGVVAVLQQLPSVWFKELKSSEFDGPEAMVVLAGQQAAVPREGPVTLRRVNTSKELAWVKGRLIFERKTIAEAIDEFNRRNRVQIVVADQELATRAVTGVLDAGDPESFARLLARTFDASIDRSTPGMLLLEPRAASNDDGSPVGQGASIDPLEPKN